MSIAERQRTQRLGTSLLGSTGCVETSALGESEEQPWEQVHWEGGCHLTGSDVATVGAMS